MGRKGMGTGRAEDTPDSLMEMSCRERLRRHLESRGIPADSAVILAERLEGRMGGLDAEAQNLILEGVADAYMGPCESRDALADRLCEVREIERLMFAFSEELGKLDEILEVLSAHVRRMRLQSDATGPQKFH